MDIMPPLELDDLKKQIYEYKDFTNTSDLYDELKKIQNENTTTIEQFRELIIQLTEDLSNVSGEQMLIQYKKLIIDTINSNPKKIIDNFILEAYNKNNGLFRKQIVSQNEEFFMKKSFDEFTGNDKNIIDKLFQFKSFWSKLSEDNKLVIKCYLVALCSYADTRYINFYKYCDMKKKYPNYKSLFDKFDNSI
jgi:hypothetical protein